MIGDFFGGIGACGSQPVFLGRSVFHSAGSTFGDDDFHLIAPGNPTTFNGAAAGSTGVAFVFDNQGNLVGFGRPGQTFVAVPTAEFVNVNDPNENAGEFNNLQVFNIFSDTATDICVPSPGTSAVGRVKLAENTSPLPRDRVFVNYSNFQNVPLQHGGVDVNRFVPGFEKTFFNRLASFELRAPFASTLTSDLVSGGLNDDSNFEWGNASVVGKLLLARNDCWALSTGLQIALPTADDLTLTTPAGTRLLEVENEAVHLMPFLGILYTPNERFFSQLFLQIDTDVNGNPVAIRDPFTNTLADAGKLDDQDFLYVDLAFGYWLMRDNSGCSRISGIAPIFEVHWNTSIEESTGVEQSGLRVGSLAEDIDQVNLVAGVTVECTGNTTLTTAFAAPVGGDADRDFDGELRVIFNRRFGPQNRASRAQFAR